MVVRHYGSPYGGCTYSILRLNEPRQEALSGGPWLAPELAILSKQALCKAKSQGHENWGQLEPTLGRIVRGYRDMARRIPRTGALRLRRPMTGVLGRGESLHINHPGTMSGNSVSWESYERHDGAISTQ